jgi:acetate CoA/acetoacetate CoA-transferase beta subunit
MDAQNIIARRIARELSSGMLVNLGIGIPTLVANYVPSGMHVFFQSENGLLGTGFRLPTISLSAGNGTFNTN